MDFYLESEINVPLDNVAGSSIYFGAKHLMAYAQLCLIADEMERWGQNIILSLVFNLVTSIGVVHIYYIYSIYIYIYFRKI